MAAGMRESRATARILAHVGAASVTIAAVTLLAQVPAMTARATVPVLLLTVLGVARTWGTGPALLAAGSASVGYTYQFLPQGGGGLAEQWVGFISFTVCAVIVGELAGRAEQRKIEAEAGRREIERLYQELQAAFERASEVEAARRNEQLKAALLDALTHNLRTPLTAIKASVTALMGKGRWKAAELEGDVRRELLQVIDEESDRLNRFIEGLSTAGRPDQSQPLRFSPIRLQDVVEAALARAGTVTRHHRVEVAVDDDIPLVSVDPAAITEVLYILLDNASKYAPADTRIRLSASRQDARFVVVEVADQGPGIPPMLRERVFDKFFRIPGREPSDPHRAGIGLGLPIARRLVEAQAGRIWIEAPSWRQGTAVVLTLPISAAVSESSVAASAPRAVASQER
jgi:two-component system sensor histidine kinase KdpD